MVLQVPEKGLPRRLAECCKDRHCRCLGWCHDLPTHVRACACPEPVSMSTKRGWSKFLSSLDSGTQFPMEGEFAVIRSRVQEGPTLALF